MDDDDRMWTLTTSGAAIAAAMVARKGLARGWERTRGAIPTSPGDGKTSWSEAVMWAVLSGVVVGVARLAATRGVALAFEKRRAGRPPAAGDTTAA